ncbi:MAG TPA: ABC transporter permease [Chitinophagaceae bacterium]|nr:ABC transporter permease [Chitinophagaceae bacterium]
MLKNYLKITFRNLVRHKGFSAINISGLAVGMASAILIFLWMFNEISYDRFHDNKNYLYQAWNRGVFDGKLQCWNSTPRILGPTLKHGYPEVANSCRQYVRWYVTTVGDKKVSSKALITDPSFLSMFSFPLVEGNVNTVLNNVYSIVITEKMAKKMFGTEDAMNKVITIDQDNFTVTGILKDLPSNTEFNFEYILPWAYLIKTSGDDTNWGNNMVGTFVQLKPGTNAGLFNEKIRDITIKHSNKTEEHEVFLHPLSKWHLYSSFENGKISGGRITIVRLFGIIGCFILLIACINFMNLSTARSEKRAKEVGIRKVAGANRHLLIGQFIGESVMIAFIAGLIALALVYLSLPAFNKLVSQELGIPYTNLSFWMIAVLFVILTGIIAGSYPAFFLSSFKPITVLKGRFKKSHAAINPRKVLVVLQFSFAIILVISTLIVVQQIRHAQNRDAGYDRGQVVYHWITGDIDKNFSSYKNELLQSGIASSITRTSSPLSFGMSDTWDLKWQGKDLNEKIDFDRFSEDEGLVETAGLTILQGRDMDLTKYPTDSTAMLINESAAKVMGFENPLGQLVKDGDVEYHIVGVIKDFLLGSPYDPAKPIAIEGIKSDFRNVVHIKLSDKKSTAESVEIIGKLFKKFNPAYPYENHFLDEDYARKFEDTQRTATLTGLFAGLTIFISCLGLFGLAAYMAENRIKEIGVRKVLGASVFNITALLSKEFLVLVIIAILIASPIAWYAMHEWLQGYSYRINIQWWVFGFSGLMAVLIALLTVSFQAIKAAIANPVKSLRTE